MKEKDYRKKQFNVLINLLMFLFFARKSGRRLLDVWIKAMMLWISIVYISLEILTVFSCVNYAALLVVWIGVDIILAIGIAT